MYVYSLFCILFFSMNDPDIYTDSTVQFSGSPPDSRLLIRPQPNGRRISTGCMRTEITGDNRQVTIDKPVPPCTPSAFHKCEQQRYVLH